MPRIDGRRDDELFQGLNFGRGSRFGNRLSSGNTQNQNIQNMQNQNINQGFGQIPGLNTQNQNIQNMQNQNIQNMQNQNINQGFGQIPGLNTQNQFAFFGGTSLDTYDPYTEYQKNIANLGLDTAIRTKDILNNYQSVIGDTRFQEAVAKGAFQNADIVLDNIRKVREEFVKGVENPLLISRNTGLSVPEVQKVLRGEAYKDLKFSERASKEYERPLQKSLTDLALQKERDLEDVDLKSQILKENFYSQLKEIEKSLNTTVNSLLKRGALTGQAFSSGYAYGLENIKSSFEDNIENLKKNYHFDSLKVQRIKDRLLEDYQTNIDRIKENFLDNMNAIKLKAISNIQDIQNKYGMASETATKMLNELWRDNRKQSMEMYDNFVKNFKTLNEVNSDRLFDLALGASLLDTQKNQVNASDIKIGTQSQNYGFKNSGIITSVGATFGGPGGIDIAGKKGTSILSEKDGIVFNFGVDRPVTIGGVTYPPNKFIEILSDGHIIRYNHLDSINKSLVKGQTVKAGEIIGLMGNTGVTTAKGGVGGVHVDITAYEAITDKTGKVRRGKIYTDPNIQISAILGLPLQSGQKSIGTTGDTQNKHEKISKLGKYIIDILPSLGTYSENKEKAFKKNIANNLLNRNYNAIIDMGRNVFTQNNKEIRNTIEASKSFLTGIEQLENLFLEYEKSNKSTSVIENFAENIARSLGATKDVMLVKIKTQLGAVIADYVKSISGAGVTDNEMQRFLNLMPNIKNIRDVNMAIIKQLKTKTKTQTASILESTINPEYASILYPEFYSPNEYYLDTAHPNTVGGSNTANYYTPPLPGTSGNLQLNLDTKNVTENKIKKRGGGFILELF